MGGSQDRLTLASTSPQRRSILEQLAIPFEVVSPAYVEDDPPDADPAELVRRHAQGKARSVHAAGRITLGVDTTVVLDGRVYGKPADDDEAARMLHELSGRTHTVVSGPLPAGSRGRRRRARADRRSPFGSSPQQRWRRTWRGGEWEGRAGGYAIQGLGGRLVERIEGDYLNVVGLPGALLVSLLERHAPRSADHTLGSRDRPIAGGRFTRREALREKSLHSAKEGARGRTMGSPTLKVDCGSP